MNHINKKKYKRIPLREIREFANRIAGEFDVERIILFGSYAYGHPTEDSDVDVLIVMDHDKKRNRQQGLEISSSCYPRKFPLDLIVRRPRELVRRIPMGDWFLKEVCERGKVLYERTVS
jgi:predicted nucleotidyltransferase